MIILAPARVGMSEAIWFFQKQAEFENQVMMLTGRKTLSVKRLVWRLTALAHTSGHSVVGLMNEWLRRHLAGWGSTETRSRVYERRAFGGWYTE